MSARWPQLLARVVAAEQGDATYRYAEPSPAPGVESDPHQLRDKEAALWSELIDRACGPLRPHPGLALDAGCGTGVHLAELAARYRHVLAIDADPARIATLRAAGRADGDRVGCATLCLQDPALRDPLLQEQFALVHCIQVLGHVATGDLPLILDTLGRLLAPGGHLLLAVPFTNRERDGFLVATRLADGTVRGRDSDQRECDRLIAAPAPGQLPVHHFAQLTLLAAIRSSGLAIVDQQPYNWFSYEHADMMVLAQKRAPSSAKS
jgi:SAM-dependent methyltransferase